MTLRNFLKSSELNINYKDRAKIGFKLKFLKSKYNYAEEHNYMVRDYEDGFFERLDVQKIILKHITSL